MRGKETERVSQRQYTCSQQADRQTNKKDNRGSLREIDNSFW